MEESRFHGKSSINIFCHGGELIKRYLSDGGFISRCHVCYAFFPQLFHMGQAKQRCRPVHHYDEAALHVAVHLRATRIYWLLLRLP